MYKVAIRPVYLLYKHPGKALLWINSEIAEMSKFIISQLLPMQFL